MLQKQILFWLTGLLLLTSCSIEKRYHSSGFHVAWHKPFTIKNLADKQPHSIKNSYQSIQKKPVNKLQINVPGVCLTKPETLAISKPLKTAKNRSLLKHTNVNLVKKPNVLNIKTQQRNNNEPLKYGWFTIAAWVLLGLSYTAFLFLSPFPSLSHFAILTLAYAALYFAGYSLVRILEKPPKYKGTFLTILCIFLAFGAVLLMFY